MTVSNDTPQRVTLVAVDIAKNYHDVLIQPPPPGRRRHVRVAKTDRTSSIWPVICRGSRVQS